MEPNFPQSSDTVGFWMTPMWMVHIPKNFSHQHNHFCSPHWQYPYYRIICWGNRPLLQPPQITVENHRIGATELSSWYCHNLQQFCPNHIPIPDCKNQPTCRRIWPNRHMCCWYTMVTGLQLVQPDKNAPIPAEIAELAEWTPYHSLMGSLMDILVAMWPNISYAVGWLLSILNC